MNRRRTRKRPGREKTQHSARKLADRLNEIARHCGSLPIRDTRSEDEILGYDARGLPG